MTKEKLLQIIDDAKQILCEHNLCDHCLGRMFAKKLRVLSYTRLGKNIRYTIKQKNPKSCYICKNLMRELEPHLNKMFEISKEYEFATFLVGAVLKPSILDRDDIIRSKLKIGGIAGIKSEVTREIGKRFGKKTRTRVDYNYPDVVFTIDFRKDSHEIKSKAVILQGRYTKKIRGIIQKQKPCVYCEGKGCLHCNFHGISEFNSVEGRIAKFLFEKFGAQQAKITWIGSEDESSLVLGKGRPFFAKLTNPHRRNISFPKKIKLDGVLFLNLQVISKIPSDSIKFRTYVEVQVETEGEIDSTVLQQLHHLKDKPIKVRDGSGWKNHKKIYGIKFKKKTENSFTALVQMDGGIPIKRLVSGPEIEPSFSSILENQCKCRTFDFHKIILAN